MYYDDNMRQGYYCDQCNEGCCSSHWIICNDCMYALRMAVFSAKEKLTNYFVVNHSVMNGTVTMTTTSMLIESESYEEAVNKFKEHCLNKKLSVRYYENEDGLLFNIEQPDKSYLRVNGSLPKLPIQILGK